MKFAWTRGLRHHFFDCFNCREFESAKMRIYFLFFKDLFQWCNTILKGVESNFWPNRYHWDQNRSYSFCYVQIQHYEQYNRNSRETLSWFQWSKMLIIIPCDLMKPQVSFPMSEQLNHKVGKINSLSQFWVGRRTIYFQLKKRFVSGRIRTPALRGEKMTP